MKDEKYTGTPLLASASENRKASKERMLRKMQHAIFSTWENNLPERRMRAESFIAYAAGWLRESK